jgi:hypothetical protein
MRSVSYQQHSIGLAFSGHGDGGRELVRNQDTFSWQCSCSIDALLEGKSQPYSGLSMPIVLIEDI